MPISLKLLTSPLLIIVLILLLLTGCDNSSPSTDAAVLADKSTTNYDNESEGNIFEYKGAYVGDNSAIGQILNILDITNGEATSSGGFQLITDTPPYGIEISYTWTASEQRYKQTAVYYATYFFVLVRNADFVTFNFNEQSFTVTKEALIDWYGQDFTTIDSQEVLELFLNNKFDVERIDALF